MANANVVTWAGRSIYNTRLKAATTGSAEPLFIGWGLGASGSGQILGSAFSDVNLFNSVALQTTPESRATGTSSVLQTNTNALADTYQVTGTVTALAARAITEVGLFDVGASIANNSAQATVASMTAAVTSVVIGANTKAFPAGAGNNYYAQIESEVVLVTGGQGTSTLTFTRAALGSVANSHAAGVAITAGGDGQAQQVNAAASAQTFRMDGANGGSMFVHADFPVINLLTSDSIAFTLKVQLS